MADEDNYQRHIYIEVANAALYHELRGALAAGEFEVTAISKWPVADLTNERRTVVARALIKPSKHLFPMNEERLAAWEARVADHLSRLGDSVCDVLDIVIANWIRQASQPTDLATITTKDFLEWRGLKAQKAPNGKRSGYNRALKDEVAQQIHLLNNIWLTVFDIPNFAWDQRVEHWKGETKALVIHSLAGPVAEDGEIDAEVWRVAPGEVFARYLMGPGRQTALLSQKAIYYNPKTHWAEKRLCRLFAYLTRIRQRQGNYCGPFRVRTLLNSIRMEIEDSRPGRTRERFELALNRLAEDGVLAEWRYHPDDLDPELVATKNWHLRWQEWRIEVAPPEEVMERYAGIQHLQPAGAGTAALLDPMVVAFNEERRRRAVSIQQAAGQLGLHWNHLAMVLRGSRKLSDRVRQQMSDWIVNVTPPQDV